MPDANTTEIIGSAPSVAGAVATALTGWWAYQAAKSSSETARAVHEAHAVAVRPELVVSGSGYTSNQGEEPRKFALYLTNHDVKEALDVRVVAEWRTGEVTRAEVPSVPGRLAEPSGGFG